MQFDYMDIFYKYGIYAVMIIAALILALLARNRFVRSQKTDDSDKLETPTYEEMDPGIKLSEPEDDD